MTINELARELMRYGEIIDRFETCDEDGVYTERIILANDLIYSIGMHNGQIEWCTFVGTKKQVELEQLKETMTDVENYLVSCMK